MAILNFQKPDKIILQKATDFEAQFDFPSLFYNLWFGACSVHVAPCVVRHPSHAAVDRRSRNDVRGLALGF